MKGELATAIQTDMNTDNTDEATTDATSVDIVTAESTSQRSLAIATVRQKRAYHVPEAHTFVVEGSKGDKYTVEMFPQEKMPMSVIMHVLLYNSSSYDTEFGQHRREKSV